MATVHYSILLLEKGRIASFLTGIAAAGCFFCLKIYDFLGQKCWFYAPRVSGCWCRLKKNSWEKKSESLTKLTVVLWCDCTLRFFQLKTIIVGFRGTFDYLASPCACGHTIWPKSLYHRSSKQTNNKTCLVLKCLVMNLLLRLHLCLNRARFK